MSLITAVFIEFYILNQKLLILLSIIFQQSNKYFDNFLINYWNKQG